jgi:hypothetical protein
MKMQSISAVMILAAAGMTLSLHATAQDIPDACKADHRKVCPNAKAKEVETCLRQNTEKLSIACKVALKESQKK